MCPTPQPLVASVIIPVYNKASYLADCCASLDAQELDHARFEAVFVDDGSTDGTGDVLHDLEKRYPWVRVVTKENGGVCSARNAGIDAARGTYLFFLDPDDELSADVLSSVTSFFDAHEDEVDVVTYKIVPSLNGAPQPLHVRYETLVASGIYDLSDDANVFLSQTTVNICVKNRFENNHHFDFVTKNGPALHEDVQYVTELLLERLKIGYVDGPTYVWKQNDTSASSTILNPFYNFDSTMFMFETLFDRYDGDAPRYLQGTFVHILSWKMWKGATLPTHLEGVAYQEALDRLGRLLDRVDDDIIFTYPRAYLYHALYLASLKHTGELVAEIDGDGERVRRGDETLYASPAIEICLARVRAHDGLLDLMAVIKSPLLTYADVTLTVMLECEGASGITREELPLMPSGQDYSGPLVPLAHFDAVRAQVALDKPCTVRLVPIIEGRELPTYFTRLAPFMSFSEVRGDEFVSAGMRVRVQAEKGTIAIERLGAIGRARRMRRALLKTDRRVLAVRTAMHLLETSLRARYRAIWLYLDGPCRLCNGWLQFEHDARKDDKVLRVYVANGVEAPMFDGSHGARVTPFGSGLHKMLHVIADKRISSDVQHGMSPWDDASMLNYADLNDAEVVCLQHGVLWKHKPWLYRYDVAPFDRIVVSTHDEAQNLIGRYGYTEKDLIRGGIPRLDLIGVRDVPERRILLCPSWRRYLVGDLTDLGCAPLMDKFAASSYYRNMQELLTSVELGSFLERSDYALDIRLHPYFLCYKDLFASDNPRIRIADEEMDISVYDAAITDYSSIAFDFAYAQRPVVRYIPDAELFSVGIEGFREFDSSWDEAFGPVANTPSEVVSELETLCGHASQERRVACLDMAKEVFLSHDGSHRERIYRALMEDGREGNAALR